MDGNELPELEAKNILESIRYANCLLRVRLCYNEKSIYELGNPTTA